MTYVMVMSTDADIIDTQLNDAWDPIAQRYSWAEISAQGSLGIPNDATIVVIAHGNGDEIGNAEPGEIDIDAELFLALVQGNMAQNSAPDSIYISTCGPGIAQFAAAVRIAAGNNRIWANTRILGHSSDVTGEVPPPNDVDWTEIFN